METEENTHQHIFVAFVGASKFHHKKKTPTGLHEVYLITVVGTSRIHQSIYDLCLVIYLN